MMDDLNWTSDIYETIEIIHMGNCRINVNRTKFSAWCNDRDLIFDNKDSAAERESSTRHKISRAEYVVTKTHFC